jgi:hypothetical protein
MCVLNFTHISIQFLKDLSIVQESFSNYLELLTAANMKVQVEKSTVFTKKITNTKSNVSL